MKSAIIAALLCASVLLLPLWANIGLFVVALFVIPHRLALFLPAILSDALYAPTAGFAPAGLLMTLLVGVLLVVHWLLMTQTRVAQLLYGVETN